MNFNFDRQAKLTKLRVCLTFIGALIATLRISVLDFGITNYALFSNISAMRLQLITSRVFLFIFVLLCSWSCGERL